MSLVGFAFFLAWELTEKHPVVDLRLFKRRNFWSGTLAIAIGYGLFFGNVVLLPLWLQQFMGYTSTQAGMLMAPVGLFAIILSPVVGKNISKFDPRSLTTFAFAVFALVLFMRSHFNTQADFGTIMVPTVTLVHLSAKKYRRLVEFIELADHPFWMGTQAHPEFKSRPDRAHPLFAGFAAAAKFRAEGRKPHIPIDIPVAVD